MFLERGSYLVTHVKVLYRFETISLHPDRLHNGTNLTRHIPGQDSDRNRIDVKGKSVHISFDSKIRHAPEKAAFSVENCIANGFTIGSISTKPYGLFVLPPSSRGMLTVYNLYL